MVDACRRRSHLIAVPAVRERLAGILLFLPVPVVLVLFTRQPLGPWLSLGLGVAIMLTHRLYARPFALARSGTRCLWCGGSAGDGPPLELREPLGRTAWRTCSADHQARLGRTLGWAIRRRAFLAILILGSILVFLVGAIAAAAMWPPWLQPADPVAGFRVGVAIAVLPLGWLAPLRGPTEPPRGMLPFPVHIQALIGTAWVLWLFRLVGIWWLVAGALHLASRLIE
jgi:hypothetical protein